VSEDVQRSRGRPQNYKQDRGGFPAEYGPFEGVVKNNVDPTRSGRLEVYIEAFSDGNPDDPKKWLTVAYLPSFYGYTPAGNSPKGTIGTYPGTQNSYGMWFTPPDLGVRVLCVFVNGDRQLGYYIGVVPESGLGHMVPAIGGSTNYDTTNKNQQTYFADAALLPVSEINTSNLEILNASRFFDKPKPVHSVVSGAMFQQGLITDAKTLTGALWLQNHLSGQWPLAWQAAQTAGR
jgi:hypothetical protein